MADSHPPTSPGARDTEKPRDPTWLEYAGILAIVSTLIWFPHWTIEVALSLAVVTEFFPQWLGEDTSEDTLGCFKLFALGIAFFCLELLDWYFLYSDRIFFRDVIIPIEDPPYDLRAIFFGWLLVLTAAMRKLRQFFTEDPKLDT